ncbi:MAG: hypothetical protein LUG89_04660 [Methanosphaera sp.]|nr:hypothetical protein [Methanosphaera sp.]
MNSNGQLIYDALLSIIILLIVVTLAMYMLEADNEVYNNNENTMNQPLDTLELIKNTPYKDGQVLDVLVAQIDTNASYNNTIDYIDNIIATNTRYDYTFCDLSINTTLINHTASTYRDKFTGRCIINDHIFELTYYR